MLPSVDELLALDALTLREHTELAGDVFDIDRQRVSLSQSLAASEVCAVRREGELVAYSMLRLESEGCWFVGAFNTHPLYRTSAVLSELIAKLAMLVRDVKIEGLKSHVYKTNRMSIAFHRKLGFEVTRENEKALELFASVTALDNQRVVRGALNRWVKGGC